ncbi:MAG TPA: T9SS type A sorting domain-containing protein [Caldithrix abyssi]|uniref:T9SS type A sorting domain-containing protein n=1 Tax=Caldithrix abyssi TaxID=187145 RepID=A0A7V1LML1_CALAY|nr:T9SS type A sorting domain-containing protein [Caldithrix abyssi]
MNRMLSIRFLIVLFSMGMAFAQSTLNVSADDGYINEVIGADTLSNGAQAHDVYKLTSLDKTYKFTGAILSKSPIRISGVVDSETGQPPTIQPAILSDFSLPPTFLIAAGEESQVTIENVYLLAYAADNSVNGDGVAISVTADKVRLTVENCVFDGWQAFAIGYNGQWCDFFINNNTFRNFVHPNQHYIGEVIRNTWPGEAYTDTLSMVGNVMLCVNGYAAAPVTKYYETYFEFIDNKVLYTFKNPFFIFNVTNAKINDNVFYGTYAGGVDQTENPWWDNLWYPDSSYGVIAFQPLDSANAGIFAPEFANDADFLAKAEAKRTIEVKNNQYYWPSELTDFWTDWNNTQSNKIITPEFMNERTVAMFADKSAYPNLVESNNTNTDPGFMDQIDPDVLNGSDVDGSVGLLTYFEQIRTGTAAVDYWGYGYTYVDGSANWTPDWPLPESQYVVTALEDPLSPAVPLTMELHQNYPNPFNPATTISFSLNKAGNISLDIFNIQGQKVKTVLDQVPAKSGYHSVRVDMSDLSSGVYYYRLKGLSQSISRKMMFLK